MAKSVIQFHDALASWMGDKSLPYCPIEPSGIGIAFKSELDSLEDVHVVALDPLVSSSLLLARVPRRVAPGAPLQIVINVTDKGRLESFCLSTEAAEVMSKVAADLHVVARCIPAAPSSDAVGSVPQLDVTVRPIMRGLHFEVMLQTPASAGWCFVVDDITVGGVPIARSGALPAACLIRRSRERIRLLQDGSSNLQTPCINGDGVIVVPRDGSQTVHLFSPDGAPIDGVPLSLHELRGPLISSGYDDASDTLLLCDCRELLALRFNTREVLWRVTGMDNCCGLAVIPARSASSGTVLPVCTLCMYRIGVREEKG
jgi:hypothetical protein